MLKRIITVFLDLLLPPRKTEVLMRSLTLRDLQTLSYGSESGALPYDDFAVKALVWELKYHKDPYAAELGGTFLSEQLLALAADELGTPLLVPIPMHDKRRSERGHNQTETLCKAALAHVGGSYEYAPELLVRTRYTNPQQGLPQHKRLRNVSHSMEVCAPERVRGRVCVVVDDVATTGATLKEAERALKLAGARTVHCVALAHS